MSTLWLESSLRNWEMLIYFFALSVDWSDEVLSVRYGPSRVAVLRSCSSPYWSLYDYSMTTLTLSFMCKSAPHKRGFNNVPPHHSLFHLWPVAHATQTRLKTHYGSKCWSIQYVKIAQCSVNVFLWVMTCLTAWAPAARQADARRRVHKVLRLAVVMVF